MKNSPDAKNIFRTAAVTHNPVLIEAIGLAPILAVATSAKSALFLSVLTAFSLFTTEALTSTVLKKFQNYIRMPFYLLTGTLITVFSMWFAQKFFPEFSVKLGLFLPLTAVSSLIALHCERFALKTDIKETMIHACGTSVGYFAVTLITGIIREILSQASVFDIKLNISRISDGFALPFFAFVILGFMSAILKAKLGIKYENENAEKAFMKHSVMLEGEERISTREVFAKKQKIYKKRKSWRNTVIQERNREKEEQKRIIKEAEEKERLIAQKKECEEAEHLALLNAVKTPEPSAVVDKKEAAADNIKVQEAIDLEQEEIEEELKEIEKIIKESVLPNNYEQKKKTNKTEQQKLKEEKKRQKALEVQRQRLEQERKEKQRVQELERQKLEQERQKKQKALELERQKLEQERQEKQKAAELERLRLEQEKKEKQKAEELEKLRIERERQEKQKALERERQKAAELEKLRLEQEEMERQKAEELEKRRLEREEKERQKAEELEKRRLEQERKRIEDLERHRLIQEEKEKKKLLELEKLRAKKEEQKAKKESKNQEKLRRKAMTADERIREKALADEEKRRKKIAKNAENSEEILEKFNKDAEAAKKAAQRIDYFGLGFTPDGMEKEVQKAEKSNPFIMPLSDTPKKEGKK